MLPNTLNIPSNQFNNLQNHSINQGVNLRHDSFDELFLNAPQPVRNNNSPPPQNEHHAVVEQRVENQINSINNENPEDIQKALLLEFTINMMFSHFFAFFFVCRFLFETTLYLIFLPLFIIDFHDFILIISRFTRKKGYIYLLLEKILSVVIKSLILSNYEYNIFQFSIISIFIIIYCLIRIIKYMIDRSSKDCQSIIDFFSMGFRIYIAIQGITIFCKLDGYITWEWGEVFWSFWVIFSVLIGVNFGLFFMLMSKMCQTFFGEANHVEFKGIFWLMIVASTFTIISSQLILGMNFFLSDGDSDTFLSSIYCIVLSFIFNLLLVVIWKKDLIKFLGSSDDNTENSPLSAHNKSFGGPKWLSSSAIPKFLTKFSSTYFKKADITSAYLKEKKAKSREERKQNPKKKKKNIPFSANLKKSNSTNILGQHLDPSAVILKNYEKEKVVEIKNKIRTSANHINFNVPPDEHLSIDISALNEMNKDESPEFILPNAIVEDQTNENDNDLKIAGPSKPSVIASFKKMKNKFQKKLQLNIDDNIKLIKNKAKFSKQHPQSATLPKPKDNTGLFNQIRKISNNDMEIKDELKGKRSESMNFCLVCFDKLPNAVFMNCGHGGICYECGLEVLKANGECYLCREKIVQILQIDLNPIEGQFIKVIKGTDMPPISEKNDY